MGGAIFETNEIAMEKPFLTAQWRNLINLTYQVPHELLSDHLPQGITLEQRDGKAFVSFVAFDFLDTRVKNFRIPFHVNFPEINLRFYVRYKGVRGVVFIKEYVPHYATAWLARNLYNEPYQKALMSSGLNITDGIRTVDHSITVRGKTHRVAVRADANGYIPAEDTEEHFFKEHEWGFGSKRNGTPLYYQVKHPVWETYPVESQNIEVDFAALYGEQWAFLNGTKPYKTLLAEGSAIQVFNARPLSNFNP